LEAHQAAAKKYEDKELTRQAILMVADKLQKAIREVHAEAQAKRADKTKELTVEEFEELEFRGEFASCQVFDSVFFEHGIEQRAYEYGFLKLNTKTDPKIKSKK